MAHPDAYPRNRFHVHADGHQRQCRHHHQGRQPGTPGVIIVPEGMDPSQVIPVPSATPVPSFAESPQIKAAGAAPPGFTTPGAPAPTSVSVATDTPEPTATSTSTATPSPFVLVQSGWSTAPGLGDPLVAQLGPDIPVAIIGQNSGGDLVSDLLREGEAVWVQEPCQRGCRRTVIAGHPGRCPRPRPPARRPSPPRPRPHRPPLSLRALAARNSSHQQ
ncbi:MAG: hypothetical protein R3A10_00525 [Caldilineaceae bacterium]